MADGYITTEELRLLHQLENGISIAAKECEVAVFALEKVHAEKRAAEAELRAVQAEYRGTVMKLDRKSVV